MKFQLLAAMALAFAMPPAVRAEPPSRADCACQKAHKPARKPVKRAPATPRPPAVSNVITLPPARLETPCGNSAIGTGQGTQAAMRDHHCELLRNSALLDSLGKREAAVAMLCTDARLRHALESTGTACPPAEMPQREHRGAAVLPDQPPAPLRGTGEPR